MNPTENFKNMHEKLTELIEHGCGNFKATIIFNGDLGGVVVLPVTIVKAELKPYAQYHKTNIRIELKKKGGRSLYEMDLNEGFSFAIFSGWGTSSFKQPSSFLCFDNNVLYDVIDGMTGVKVAENSDRVYEAERQAMPKMFEVVRIDKRLGRCVVDSFDSVKTLTEMYEQTGTHSSPCTRIELQGAPTLKELCGPMYDGEKNGWAVIRYETQEVYDALSC